MKIEKMKNKLVDELYENFEHRFEDLDILEVSSAVDIIKDLEIIEAMEKSEDKEEHAAMRVYMAERTMNSLINYINELSDEVHTMLRESPSEHKSYVRQALSTLLSNM